VLRDLLLSANEKAARSFVSCIQSSFPAAFVFAPCAEKIPQDAAANCDLIFVNDAGDGAIGPATVETLLGRTHAQIIYLAPQDIFEKVKPAMITRGVVTLSKPVSRQSLILCVDLLQAVRVREAQIRKEKERLEQSLRDSKLVSRAKLVLIQVLGMTEPQAHRQIEKQAMDQQLPRGQVAMNILRLYDQRPNPNSGGASSPNR
jgi:response regulator NasT